MVAAKVFQVDEKQLYPQFDEVVLEVIVSPRIDRKLSKAVLPRISPFEFGQPRTDVAECTVLVATFRSDGVAHAMDALARILRCMNAPVSCRVRLSGRQLTKAEVSSLLGSRPQTMAELDAALNRARTQ